MGIPLPALSIRPPEDLTTGIMRAMQIRALMQGQQLSEAELKQRQLQNQSMTMTLQGQQQLRAAEQDPEWDPTDLDKALRVMHKYSVPTDTAKNVISGISQIREGLSKASTEQIAAIQATHGYMDDQFQAVKAAPDDQKQNTYSQGIQNVKQHIATLPPGPARDQMTQELANVPALYDPTWVNEQHASLRSMQFLTDEALKTAQTNEAQAKTTQATAEAGKANVETTKTNMSDELLSARAAQGDKLAQSILNFRQSRQVSTAGQTEAAKSAAEFPYQQKLEQLRQGGSPVYAFDPKQNATVLTTKEEAQQGGMKAIRKVGEGDIAKDTQMQRQLGDAQLNVSAYRAASQKMDELSGTEIARVGDLLGGSGFKAHFLGAELPSDWANELRKNQDWTKLPADAREAVESYIGARGAIIAYAKAISGSGRLTESQLQTEMQNLPAPTSPSDVREKQFDRFQRNIDQAASGLPKIPGVDSPAAIRARIEGQATAEQAARAKIQAAEDAKSGQFSDPKKSHQVGEKLLYKGEWRRVTRVYKDNSFDMEID